MTDGASYPDHLVPHLRRLHGRSPGGGRPRPPSPAGPRRAALRSLLGLTAMAAELGTAPPPVEVVSREARDGYWCERALVRTEATIQLPVWVLVPDRPGPFPVVLTPHGHTHRGADQYIGIPRDEADVERIRTKRKDLAVQAVRRGYLAVVPPTRGFEPIAYPDLLDHHGGRSCHVQLVHTLLAGRTPLGERIWDLQRVLDWALQRADVDPGRVASVGHSGGGVLSWLLAAVDERIAVAVANEAFCPLVGDDLHMRFCACNTVPGLTRWGEIWDVLALVAPRPFLAVSGTEGLYPRAEIDRAVAETARVYAERDAGDRFAHVFCPGPCRIYPEAIWPRVDAELRGPGGPGGSGGGSGGPGGRTSRVNRVISPVGRARGVERDRVELCPIEPGNVRAFAALDVRADQRGFVKPNALSIAEGLLAANGWVRGVTLDGRPVGLVVVRLDEPVPGEHHLWRLMVDAAAQRQGIGSAVLDATWRDLAARGPLRRVHLRYVMAPGHPRRFYERNGFLDTGRTFGRDGELEICFAPEAAASSPASPPR